ncbi:MAG: neutral/alkaline non-lysosomal ceramidase N-terminal domain-containing protein [Armatimonadota bacterium]
MATIRVGYGERVITPSMGIEMTGYGYYLERRVTEIRDELKARALVLEGDGGRLALLTCDLLGFHVPFSDAARAATAAALDIPRERVLLACTHTHTGPVSQTMEGLGTEDDTYMASLAPAFVAAARDAAADLQEATVSFRNEIIEPIGLNRRKGTFDPIDPTLKMLVFTREQGSIFLLNYACHPVTMAASSRVSADWPGAAVAALETAGHRALVFQGFAGDINPVAVSNGWGKGADTDIELYGEILCRRALKAAHFSTPVEGTEVAVIERRVQLPLDVFTPERAVEYADFWESRYAHAPAAQQFLQWWRRQATERAAEFTTRPYLAHIPFTALRIGEVKIIALPGEVFCSYGLRLRETHPQLLTFGYANGSIGYFPTEDAFQDPGDYAAYSSPQFYSIYPFTPDLERLVLEECENLLAELG